MFGRYVISLSKFKLEEQLSFAAKVNIMNISRQQLGLNTTMKHIGNNGLGHLVKKVKMHILFYCNISDNQNVL